jgi:hypothetical protein
MNEIRLQVRRARRRLVIQQFLSIVTWCLFGFLLLAAIGVAIPKIWPVSVRPEVWLWSWVGGSLGVAMLVACVWTYLVRRQSAEAAVEVDRRFGLRERVASSLTLSEQELQSEFGKALLQDAERRVARLNIGEQFRIALRWWNMLPIVPTAVIVAVALLLVDATERNPAVASSTAKSAKDTQKMIDEMKILQEKLRKKVEQQNEKGKLEEAENLLKEIQKTITEMEKKKNTLDKKQVMVKLNDLNKQLKSAASKFSSAEEMKKQLNGLKEEEGPAKDFASNLKKGDFAKAAQAMRDMEKKVKEGKMSPEEMKAAAKQLEQIKKQIQEMMQEREQAKEELKRQIQQKRDAGDLEGAANLQKKLDKMEAQEKSAQQMQQMADQLEKAAEAMQQGDPQKSQQQMADMAKQLEQMQQQSEDMETLDGMMMELSDAKMGMGEEESDKDGEEGEGKGKGKGRDRRGDRPGDGDGEGQGFGERPEEETEYKTKDSKVEAKPKPGESIKIGTASGPNSKGVSKESAKAIIEASESADDDPLTNQTLPRAQKQHAKEYFQKFGKGE